MGEALGIIAAAVAIMVGLCTLLGIAVRFALVPYLETHLIAPQRATRELVEETHKQVTVNHHSSPEPTVLDRIDDVSTKVGTAIDKVDTLGRMFDGHLEQAQADRDLIQSEVDRIWDAMDAKRGNQQ